MTLALDERRLAILEQFGIRLPASAACHAGSDPASGDFEQEDTGLRVEPAMTAVTTVEPAPGITGVELMEWDALAEAVASCRACKLCITRRNTVFGVGDRQADWLIVGEAPGENEDLQGEPFVGQAGKLLDNMLRALGLSRREKVYIANVLKCRPPGNRNPEPEEVSRCEPFLRRQVQLLEPKVIVAMGRFAVQSLLGSTEAIGKLRGQRHSYAGVPVVVTYHPAYLLRTLPDKAKAWADLCLAREIAASQD
jgi:DNA polymerase